MDIEDHQRLVEIRQEMMDLIEEASNLVRQADKHEYERAKAYWIAHIECALEKINPYDKTMEDTIRALEPCEEEEEEEEYEDEEDV